MQLKAWPVYSQSNSELGTQFTDFFLLVLTTSLNMSDCWDFYTGDHAR